MVAAWERERGGREGVGEVAARRSAPNPESWCAARDAGDLRPTRLDRELPPPLLHLKRRGEKAASAAACEEEDGAGGAAGGKEGIGGGESTGEKARDIFHPGRSRFSSLLSLPETHLHHEEAKNQLIPGPPQLTRPTRHLPIVPVMYVQNNPRFTRRSQKKTVAARSGGPRRRARAMPLEWRVL